MMNKTAAKASSLGRMLPGLIISALALIVLAFLIDVDQLRQAFALADFRWLPAVALVFSGTLLARAKAWRTLLQERASFVDAFLALNQGYLMNNVLPFRLGELGRALLLGERSSLSFWQVLSTVIVERIFDVGFAAALLFISLPFVVGADWALSAAWVAGLLVLLGFVLVFTLANRPAAFTKLLERLTQRWPGLQAWIAPKLDSFVEGLAALRSASRFLRVAAWLGLSWLFNVAWYYVLLFAFFPQPEWLWAALVVGAGSMGVALPSSPAYIGVLEGVIVAALALFGVEASLALAFALVAHGLYFLLTGILGALGFALRGQSLKRVYRRVLARDARLEG